MELQTTPNALPIIIAKALFLAILTGCGTLPKEYDIESNRVYEAPMDVVWEGVIEFFTGYNIPIKTVEKDSGLIYAEHQYQKPQDVSAAFYGWADCGDPSFMELDIGESLSLNLFVRDSGNTGQTTVTVNALFSRVTQVSGALFTTDIVKTPCNSTGKLEKLIFDHIDQYLEKVAPEPGNA